MPEVGDPAPAFQAVDEDGNYALPPYGGKVWYPNYTHPEVKAKAAESFKKFLKPIIDHPAFSGYVFCKCNSIYSGDGIFSGCGISSVGIFGTIRLFGYQL